MNKNLFSTVVYGWIVALFIMIFSSLFLALLLKMTELSEPHLSQIAFICGVIALFVGGVLAGLRGKNKGWMIGLFIGLGFTFIIMLLQYLGYQKIFTWKQTLYHLVYILSALIGGVFGVNFRK